MADLKDNLLFKPAPLKPPKAVRPLLVYGPPLALCVGAWVGLSASGLAVQIVAVILIWIFACCGTGYIAASWNNEVMLAEDELRAKGGHYFKRPSDGKMLEYWLSGTPSSNGVIVVRLVRISAEGVDLCQRKEVNEVLKIKNALCVSPSHPCGIGLSEPYETFDASEWLRQHSEDMVALVDHLGGKEVYVTGASWSAQLAMNLAEKLSESGRCKGVALVSPGPWTTKDVDFEDPNKTAFTKLFSSPTIMKVLAYFFFRPNPSALTAELIKDFEDPTTVPPDTQDLIDLLGDSRKEVFGRCNLDSVKYFWHQFWVVGGFEIQKRVASYNDWKVLATIPVHIHYGERDTYVPKTTLEKLQQLMPHAKIMLHERGHLWGDYTFILKELFQA
jgi:pimeloyl-ACP methyl ester carboxylesterase